jgi:hypothetical protein
MPRRLPPSTQADETVWARIRDGLTDSRTWSSMFYFLLMLPLGTAYFTVAITGLSMSLGVTAGCVYALITNDASHIHIDEVPWLAHLLHTAPGLILFALVGVLLFFIMLHVARGIGWLHGRIAELLLVRL